MKICHMVWGMSLGGTENMLVDIINKQIKDIEITLVVVDSGYNTELLSRIDSRIKVILLNRSPGKKDPLAVIKLNLFLLFNRFQVIHCHTPSLLGLILIRSLLSSKICVTVHDTNIDFLRLNRYDKIFSISQAVSADVLTRYNLNSCIVMNGIDFESIDQKTKPIPNRRVMSIIQVSRLDHEKKGQDLLLNALHEIVYKHNMPDVKVSFIGDGPSKDYLIHIAKKLEVFSKCEFLGPKNREYVYATLKDYDLLVQPSYFEGFGLTVIEGIAAMLPVLVSDIEGPADIIQYGEYGYMFKKGDASDLALKILQVMEDRREPDFPDKLKTNRDYAKVYFNVSRTARSYNNEYYQMLS